MKIDFDQELVDLKNEPLEILNRNKMLVPATLGDVCSEAMLSILETDKSEGGKAKYERWQLAGKIIKTIGPVELSTDEVSTIKTRIGKMYGPAVVGPAYDLLEKKENAKIEIQSDGESTT